MLNGIDSGSFALNIQEVSGNDIVSQTAFKSVLTEVGTVVTMDVDPDVSPTSQGVLKIDFNGDSTIDQTLVAKEDSVVSADTIAPTTTPTTSGIVGSTTVTLYAIDNPGGVGVEKTEYSLDNGTNWLEYKDPFIVSDEGGHTILFHSTDWFGNVEETKSVTFTIVNTGTLTITKKTLGGDATFNFTSDAGPFSILTSGGTGTKTFPSLTAGAYNVTETPFPGWTMVSNDCINVSVNSGETATCTITNAKQGHIIIKKVAAKATKTDTFPFLADFKPDGFSIAAGGQYDSGLLAPDTYAVTEDTPDGWILSTATCSDGSDPSAIVLDPAETVTCSFINIRQEDKNKGNISGMKFEDKNDNGKKETGENGLPGFVIYIDANNDGKLNRKERFTVTNRKGEYRLRRLPAGTYIVREAPRKKWIQTFPTPAAYTVKVPVGQTVTGKDFGNFKKGEIGGIVFEDKNGNGKLDKKEQPLKGWTITLKLPNGTTKSDMTDKRGWYWFDDLGPGTHTVREVLQKGWKETTSDPRVIVITSGLSQEDIHIGNKKL